MRKMINNKKGFTLIELIVVIAILAILAAVAVPKLGGITNSAKVSADKANAKMLTNIIEVHYSEKGTYPEGAAAATDNHPTDVEVEALVDVLITAGYIPGETDIDFNDLSKITFTESDSTVTAVNYNE